MIAYVFLSAGLAGTAALVYYIAPAGRGTHRYVVPRSVLRAQISRLEQENSDFTNALVSVTTENAALRKERDEASEAAALGASRITDLEEQLAAFDRLCAENTELRQDLANATAIRPLSPADDTASALPDQEQEFTDTTATAWRSRA